MSKNNTSSVDVPVTKVGRVTGGGYFAVPADPNKAAKISPTSAKVISRTVTTHKEALRRLADR